MLTDKLKILAFWLLLASIFTITFSISLYEITSVAFVLVSLAAMATDRGTPALKGRWMLFLAVYFAANALSLTQSHYMADSLKGLLRVFRSCALCVSVIYALDTEDKFLKAFQWYLAVAFIIALDGFYQVWYSADLLRGRTMTNFTAESGRVTAAFNQANDFSAYITLALFFFIGVLAALPKLRLSLKEALFCVAGFASLSLCLLWTYSRGAWASIAAAFFAFALLKKKIFLLAAGAAALAAVVLFSPPLLKERFRSMLDFRSGSVAARMHLMDESLTMLEKSPWFGLGINTYSANAPFFKSKVYRTDMEYVHNGYVQMAAETGIVGLFSFLAVLGYFMVSVAPVFLKSTDRRLDAAASGIIFGVLAFLIHSAMDTNLHSLLLVSNLWLCLGMGWAAAGLARKRAAA